MSPCVFTVNLSKLLETELTPIYVRSLCRWAVLSGLAVLGPTGGSAKQKCQARLCVKEECQARVSRKSV